MSPIKTSIKEKVKKQSLSNSVKRKNEKVDWDVWSNEFIVRSKKFFSENPTEKDCKFVMSEIYEITNKSSIVKKEEYWTELKKKLLITKDGKTTDLRPKSVIRFHNQKIVLVTNSVNLNNHIRKLCEEVKFTKEIEFGTNTIIVKK